MPSTTECVDTRASEKNTRITADTTCLQQGHKIFSEQNKQFNPGGRREKAPLWNAAVLYLLFLPFLGGSLFVLCASCFVSALFMPVFNFLPKLLIYSDDTSQQAERHQGDTDRVAEVRNRRASIFSPITLLKMARTSNTRFGRSANALG